jgi:DNA-directed RNA polymerase subunit M/transcription elongation factor TFIIS
MKKEQLKQKIILQNRNAPEIAVIGEDEELSLRSLPTVNVVCPSCGNKGSEVWNIETADENIHSTITFFRCLKCKTTRREVG